MIRKSPWLAQQVVVAPNDPAEDLFLEDDEPDDGYSDDLAQGRLDDVMKLNDL